MRRYLLSEKGHSRNTPTPMQKIQKLTAVILIVAVSTVYVSVTPSGKINAHLWFSTASKFVLITRVFNSCKQFDIRWGLNLSVNLKELFIITKI